MARSRSPLVVAMSGAFNSVCACRTESQFPRRTPLDATCLTRVIPLASSGASSPLSEASTANLRTAVIRTLIETAPSPRASSATRQALTVAFVKPGRGSWMDSHAKNSSSPRLYTRRVIGEETLSSTSDFSFCQWFVCGTTIKSYYLRGGEDIKRTAEKLWSSRNDSGGQTGISRQLSVLSYCSGVRRDLTVDLPHVTNGRHSSE